MAIGRRLATLVVALALLAGCARSRSAGVDSSSPSAGPTSTPARLTSATPGSQLPDSGIAGTTVVDGGCPVVRLDSPCPDRPLRAVLVVVNAVTGAQVASTTSDQDGRFRLALPPGRYVIRPESFNGAPLPRAAPVTVDVPAGRFASVTIRFDSGIR
jgi:Carboxypeptidase regulatory-like domain